MKKYILSSLLLMLTAFSFAQKGKDICKGLSNKNCAQEKVKEILSNQLKMERLRCTKANISKNNTKKFYTEHGKKCLKTGLYKNYFLFEVKEDGKLDIAATSCKYNHITNEIRSLVQSAKQFSPIKENGQVIAYKFGLPIILKYE